MERMAVSAATGVLSSLLSKLSVLLSDKYKQLKGVKRDIESLSRELTDMNAALVKLADREKLDIQTKVWRDKVREMAYDIEDIIDIFMHHHDQARDDKDGLFQKTARKIRKLRARFQIAGMIQDIKARVEEQSQSRDRYKVEESIPEPREEVDPRIRAMYEDAKRLVGIDGPREEIIKQLMEEDDSDSGRLKMLSIVGFGGLGKTTLANQVYAKIRNEFECTAFVSVSRSPHMPKILKDILFEVGYGGLEKEDDVQKLIEILRATLTNKRYLIIIDDIWSIKDWYTIECAFVENNNASKVITTTRIQDVGTACCFPSQGHVYKMQPLNELHSRSLFFKRLFDTEESCPEQFRGISDNVLRKCKGVPLAITSVASLLAKQMHVEVWEKILNSLGSELDMNPTLEWMRHVLSLSYNDLSHELKTCLLYLGTYPEDHVIYKKDVVKKWIAEGFIMEKHGLDLEEAAESCFNELINRSTIQPTFRPGSPEVEGCRVHDLLLDLIISKCSDENFMTIVDTKFTVDGASPVVRRMCLHQLNQRVMAIDIVGFIPSKVRSYTSFPSARCVPHRLGEFEILRVLDMVLGKSVWPESRCLDLSPINQLFLLRYLRVSGFRLELPKKFGKLRHLMTIDILWTKLHPIKQFSDLSSLSSLRHLILPTHEQGSLALRNGLSKLCNLRTLGYFDNGANSVECIRDLGELTNLRELSVIYSSPGDVQDNADTVLAASLDKLGDSNLRSLEFMIKSDARAPSAQFFSNLFTCPQYLQKFFCNGLIPSVPIWMQRAVRLIYLYRLRVQEVQNDDIQVLAQLPCLVYLWLEAVTIPKKNIIIRPNTFPSLKFFGLIFDELSCLTFEPAAMPQLQTLYIIYACSQEGAMQLQECNIVGGIEHLASLECLYVNIAVCAKYDHGSKVESAWRDAISRHPKRQALHISIVCKE